MTEPHPCPFCRNVYCKVSVADKTVYKTRRWVVSVYCPSCHARGPRTNYRDESERETTIERAIEMWNKRGIECSRK